MGILFERTVGEPLLVAQLHATEVQDGILHRAGHSLTSAARFTLEESGEDSGNRWMPVPESPIWAPVTRGTLSISPVVDAAPPVHCDVFIDLAVLERAGPESFD